MYPLLPWKWLGSVLAGAVALAVYADDLGRWAGIEVPDAIVMRLLPVLLLGAFGVIFGPTGYWAPWRILWRLFPFLNSYFPDLNGIWTGHTNSNWPTIKKLVEAANSHETVDEQELHNTPKKVDAIAVRINNSLFSLRVVAALSATKAESHSTVAKPWRDQFTGRVHITYAFVQETPEPAASDEDRHYGAADLAVTGKDWSRLKGVYWTRRSWRTGRNTAGTLELNRIAEREEAGQTLQNHAAMHKMKLEQKEGAAAERAAPEIARTTAPTTS